MRSVEQYKHPSGFPTLEGGLIIHPDHVPERLREEWLGALRRWGRDHPRDEWPWWLRAFAARVRR